MKKDITNFSDNDENEIPLRDNDEFPQGALEPIEVDKMPLVSRRKFLALASASAAFAVTSCTDYRDKGAIVTYNKKPENVTYGKADYYASVYHDGTPILVKTREGRPIKVIGNPEHPLSGGTVSLQAQASVLDLYDPERIQRPLRKNGNSFAEITWEAFDSEIISKLDSIKNSGKKIVFFSNSIYSPSFLNLLNEFKNKYTNTEIVAYDSINNNAKAKAFKELYGSEMIPEIDWAKPKIILFVEADLLGSDTKAHEYTKAIMSRKNIEDVSNFNRIYTVEGSMSLTGVNSDYRFRLNPAKQIEFLLALYNALKGYKSIEEFAQKNGWNKKHAASLVKDLTDNKGAAIVYAGDILSKEAHILVEAINSLIDAKQNYVQRNGNYIACNALMPSIGLDDCKALINDMNSGNVAAFIALDTNPVYNLPKAFGFAEALKKVELKIAFTYNQNETSALCNYVAAINHSIESWGDYRSSNGIYSLRQPVIESLYENRQTESVILTWLSGNAKSYTFDSYHKYLMNYWQNNIYPLAKTSVDFQKFWFASIHDGFAEVSEAGPQNLSFNNFEAYIYSIKPLDSNGFTLIVKNSYTLGDGRYANNGWLQEMPHPVTKAVWDNYVCIAPATAKKLSLQYKDFKSTTIKLTVDGKEITAPIITQPGMEENTLLIEMGYGRTNAGTIGNEIGVDTNNLLAATHKISDRIITNVSISATGEIYPLYSTQEHHLLDEEFVKDFHKSRSIIMESTVAEYVKDSKVISKKRHLVAELDQLSVNAPHEYKEVKWGMAIDLNKCTGCGQCVIACNTENNIPVVGKTEVGKGREMHWIRLDRYYSGSNEEPQVSQQPMLCQHCDMAPCENVCPVVATTHSPDGLNQMTYNRCVGTRYCANNCPYKVRRFNYFNFRTRLKDGYYEKDSMELIHNPEVTVRSRGVMEKCTFCIQRLMEGRQEATKNGETFNGHGIKTACQEACPANAIVFGNMNDPNSEISKVIKTNLAYKALEAMGIKPNITYIAKLWNKHAEDIA